VSRLRLAALALLLPLARAAATELRAVGAAPLGTRTPVVFVHGHGMDGIAASIYSSWAKFLQGRAASRGEDWWAGHRPYLFTYDVSDKDYEAVGDAMAAALRAEFFVGEQLRAATPIVGVTFSAGALVWHQAMRALPEEARGDVFSVSPPTQGTVGATFLGPYAIDRGGPAATAAFREEYGRKLRAALAEDFRTVYPEEYRQRVRRELGGVDEATAAAQLAQRHWDTLVAVHGQMQDQTSAAAFRTLAIDNLGPGRDPLIGPERLLAMGAVDAAGEPFVNTWLRDLHAEADYSRAHVYMGEGNTDLARKGLAGLLAGGGPGGSGEAERQRQVVQDVTRSRALPEGLADADPTVPRALGAGEFLPEGDRPEVVYVKRMSHHQGVFHPGVLLHMLDRMTEVTGAYRQPAGGPEDTPRSAAPEGESLLGFGSGGRAWGAPQ